MTNKTANNLFKTVGWVAKIGDVLCESQEEKNNWKVRMLKAGLENRGLIFPDNWDSLSEDEKETRLNAIINIIDENI